MPLFSSTDRIGSEFAAHVREFQKLYEFHSMVCGSPQSFLKLAPKLASSEGFRLDFSDLVRTTRDKERGRLSARDMLTIAAVAIGGSGVGAAETELEESAGTLQVLLAGVGGWRDSGGGGADNGPQIAETDGQQRKGGGSGGEVSPDMKETLARLELASMQLKIYLDDIDRRMGRIEPNLEDLTAMVHSTAGYFQGAARESGLPAGDAMGEPAEDPKAAPAAPARRRRSEEAIAAAMEMSSGARDWTRLGEQTMEAARVAEARQGATEPQVPEPAVAERELPVAEPELPVMKPELPLVEPELPRRPPIIWEVREQDTGAAKRAERRAASEVMGAPLIAAAPELVSNEARGQRLEEGQGVIAGKELRAAKVPGDDVGERSAGAGESGGPGGPAAPEGSAPVNGFAPVSVTPEEHIAEGSAKEGAGAVGGPLDTPVVEVAAGPAKGAFNGAAKGAVNGFGTGASSGSAKVSGSRSGGVSGNGSAAGGVDGRGTENGTGNIGGMTGGSAGGNGAAGTKVASGATPRNGNGRGRDRRAAAVAASRMGKGGAVEEHRTKSSVATVEERPDRMEREHASAASTVSAEAVETRRKRWIGGTVAAVVLIGATSLAYVYHPWRSATDGGDAAAAGSGRTASSAATQPTTGEAGGAVATPSTPVSVPVGASAGVEHAGEVRKGVAGTTPRKPTAAAQGTNAPASGVQANGVQASGAALGMQQLAGGVPALPTPTSAPQVTPAVTTDGAKKDDAPRDRVEGARAADAVRPPRVENLRPDEPGEGAAAGGGTAARVERAGSVTGEPAATTVATLKPGPGAADVPRAPAGRLEPLSTGGTVMSAPTPYYPPQAKQMGVQGKVVIRATVDKNGKVTKVQVVDGPVMLHRSAEDAVKRRRYKPFLLHGEPYEFQTMVTLDYKLSQ